MQTHPQFNIFYEEATKGGTVLDWKSDSFRHADKLAVLRELEKHLALKDISMKKAKRVYFIATTLMENMLVHGAHAGNSLFSISVFSSQKHWYLLSKNNIDWVHHIDLFLNRAIFLNASGRADKKRMWMQALCNSGLYLKDDSLTLSRMSMRTDYPITYHFLQLDDIHHQMNILIKL